MEENRPLLGFVAHHRQRPQHGRAAAVGGRDEDQRARFLAPLLAGRRFGWFGMTEPDAGSDAGAMRTTARRQGSTWVITGRKLYITNAMNCDFGVLLARVDGEDPGGVTAFLVEKDSSPYGVTDIPHMPVRATSSWSSSTRNAVTPPGSSPSTRASSTPKSQFIALVM